MESKNRTLFSVIEVKEADGTRYCQVDWHPDISAILDEISPSYQLTDKIIDMAESILEDEDELTAESAVGQHEDKK